ncbi:unnamed protein product [Darwinula stevensoni]|uniref:Uncharacterized protein n=1 Tax=Darwinula stevensoni TaxID=69355 RepID=A0A7R8X8R9_9CRUS|nr:unnamed protein product [Darwinula stevensoni]CAG0888240.1 unnamed protein product [Darwinula stevensoni]
MEQPSSLPSGITIHPVPHPAPPGAPSVAQPQPAAIRTPQEAPVSHPQATATATGPQKPPEAGSPLATNEAPSPEKTQPNEGNVQPEVQKSAVTPVEQKPAEVPASAPKVEPSQETKPSSDQGSAEAQKHSSSPDAKHTVPVKGPEEPRQVKQTAPPGKSAAPAPATPVKDKLEKEPEKKVTPVKSPAKPQAAGMVKAPEKSPRQPPKGSPQKKAPAAATTPRQKGKAAGKSGQDAQQYVATKSQPPILEPADTEKESTPNRGRPAKGQRKRRSTPPPTLDSEERRSKRRRTQTQPYQSPLPEFTYIPKALKQAMAKPHEENMTVFFRGEHLAVRNAEGGFYICQAMQNIHKNSHRIRIRWLSLIEDKKDLYSPDFYDYTDFECILCNLSMEKVEKGYYRLPQKELERTENILKRALEFEESGGQRPTVTEEHPDGIDVSILKDESQLQQRRSRKSSRRGTQEGESSEEETSLDELEEEEEEVEEDEEDYEEDEEKPKRRKGRRGGQVAKKTPATENEDHSARGNRSRPTRQAKTPTGKKEVQAPPTVTEEPDEKTSGTGVTPTPKKRRQETPTAEEKPPEAPTKRGASNSPPDGGLATIQALNQNQRTTRATRGAPSASPDAKGKASSTPSPTPATKKKANK